MFVGYSEHHAKYVYRFMNLKTNRIMTICDVNWMHLLYKDHIKEEENEAKEIITDDYNMKVKKDENEVENKSRKIKFPRAVKEL